LVLSGLDTERLDRYSPIVEGFEFYQEGAIAKKTAFGCLIPPYFLAVFRQFL
jgi:hypothetical protein